MNARTLSSSSSSIALFAAFAGIYVIWGTTYLGIALMLQSIPPFIGGGLRFTVAGALMYAWLRWRGARPLAEVSLPLAALCGVLLSGIGNGFVIWAQQGIPSGIAALIVSAVPVVVLVLDWSFFGKRAPAGRAVLGIAIALAGVAAIVLHTRSLSGAAQPLHVIVLLAAVVGWSFGTLLQKRGVSKHTVLSFTCVQMLFGGLFQFAAASFEREWPQFEPSAITLSSFAALVYLILFGSIIGLNCYLWLLTRVSAQKVTTYALVNPVVALLLGALILHEKVTPTAIAATLLVLIGVGLVLFQDRPSLLTRRMPADDRT